MTRFYLGQTILGWVEEEEEELGAGKLKNQIIQQQLDPFPGTQSGS